SVRQVVEAVSRVSGRPLRTSVGPRREGDPAILIADGARARAALGWKPKYRDLASIVETAWRWHVDHPAGYGAS
ncbi:MAG: UDP-glucose 4-epimerase GalE, partial [Planctomycetota bacterium]|nr:UDP-glucose 4-epimerase GalE [Planctomycetota bacterium]